MSSVAEAFETEIAVSIPRPRILIIDDDEKFLEGARDYFSMCGYDVDTAFTPEEAKQILEDKGKDKYQVIITDDNFGKLSKTKGHQFVLENQALFGKAKTVIISGAEQPTLAVLKQLENAHTLFFEKNTTLQAKLVEITERESQKRTAVIESIVVNETARRIAEITGRPVGVTIRGAGAAAAPALAPESKRSLSESVGNRLKGTLIKWLRTRSEPDRPVLAFGKRTYSANDLIAEVSNETDVGLAHVQMLLGEFEHSLRIEEDDSQNDDAFAD